MEGKKVLGLHGSPEEIDAQLTELMKICDNLFFSDYFQNGGEYKTREEIAERLKNSVKDDFISFYGTRYTKYINERIDKQEIIFHYQTRGKNSIEQFLRDRYQEYFESKGLSRQDIINLKAFSLGKSYIGQFSRESIIDHQGELLADANFLSLLTVLGYDESMFHSPDKIDEFVELATKYSGIVYSDNPQVNADMKKLEDYVRQYNEDISNARLAEIEELGISHLMGLTGDDLTKEIQNFIEQWYQAKQKEIYEDAINSKFFHDEDSLKSYIEKANSELAAKKEELQTSCFELLSNDGEVWFKEFENAIQKQKGNFSDVIRETNDNKQRRGSINKKLYDELSGTEGSYNGSPTDKINFIQLGVYVSDWVLLHEFDHAITRKGFQREEKYLPKDKAPYSFHLTQYQMLDESWVDYCAMLMYEARKENGKGPIINPEAFKSSYSKLFPFMRLFFDEMMPDLKVISMVSDNEKSDSIFGRFSTIVSKALHKDSPEPTPVSFLASLIGQERLDRIALLCNEVIMLYHPDNEMVVENIKQALATGNISLDEFRDSKTKELQQDGFDVVWEKITGQLDLDMIHNNKYGIRDLLKDIIGFNPSQAEAVRHRNSVMGEVHKAITNPEAMARMNDDMTM